MHEGQPVCCMTQIAKQELGGHKQRAPSSAHLMLLLLLLLLLLAITCAEHAVAIVGAAVGRRSDDAVGCGHRLPHVDQPAPVAAAQAT